jgi:hypothetical protein
VVVNEIDCTGNDFVGHYILAAMGGLASLISEGISRRPLMSFPRTLLGEDSTVEINRQPH